METFREFMGKPKLWSAKKDEIIQWWAKLKPNQPIIPNPIPHLKGGSTYGQDGIRVTGSPEFITSVLSRFKDFAAQDTPNANLRLAFRQVEDKYTQTPNKDRFVFYANVTQRPPKKIKVPKLPEI